MVMCELIEAQFECKLFGRDICGRRRWYSSIHVLLISQCITWATPVRIAVWMWNKYYVRIQNRHGYLDNENVRNLWILFKWMEHRSSRLASAFTCVCANQFICKCLVISIVKSENIVYIINIQFFFLWTIRSYPTKATKRWSCSS